MPITLTSLGGALPAGVQWTFSYTSDITGVTVVTGAAASAAGKSVSCNGNECLVFGLTTTAIANGTVATATFQIAANPSTSTIPIQLTGVVASTAGGSSISASGVSGSISLPPAISAVSCSNLTINTPGSTPCTVTLNSAAPSGGFAVQLSSNNGSLTVPSSVTVTSGQTSAGFTATAALVNSGQTAVVTAGTGVTAKTVTLSLVTPAQLTSVSCAPSSLGSNASSTCTVSLNNPATSSVTVAIGSNVTALSVPSNVTIATGQSSATFAATTGTVSSAQSATVTATLNGQQQSATVSLTVAVLPSSLTCSPGTVAAPGSASCTITLTAPAPSGGAGVTLSSNNASVIVPASVTISAGQTTGAFTATVAGITSNQTAQITASYNGSSAPSFNLSATAPVQLAAVSCAPSSLGSNASSTCTVSLNIPATSPVVVAIGSNVAALSVPSSATIAAGQTSATFAATTGTVSSAQSATVTATLNGQQQSATISLTGAVVPSSLTCSPGTVIGPGSASCTITLSAPAPSGGAVIALSSNNSSVTVPANVNISAGQTTGAFTATVASITSNQTTQITASYNGNSAPSFNLSATAPGQLAAVSCAPSSLGSNASSTCTVSLNNPATSPVVVAISSDVTALAVPSSVTIAAGQTSATFAATTGTVSSAQSATVTATLNGQQQSATISLTGAVVPSSLTCSPGTVIGPGSASCTITLTGPAPSGGAVITLSSNNASVTVPPSVNVSFGQTTAVFTAAVASVTSNQTVQIIASYNGTTQSFILTDSGPLSLGALVCAPSTLGSNGTASCTLSLSQTAASSVTVALSSAKPSVSVPSSVTIPSGSASAQFNASTSTVAASDQVAIHATWNGQTQTASINLTSGPLLSGFTCASSALASNASTTCSVSVMNSGNSLVTVALSQSSSYLSFPSQVTIASGNASAVFTVSNTSPGVDGVTVIITASLNGQSQTAQITLGGNAQSLIGSMPHLLAEGGWNTTLTLVNKSSAPAETAPSLFADNGNQLALPLSLPQQASSPLVGASMDQTLAPNASFIMQASGPATVPYVEGSAQIFGTATVDGFAIFHFDPSAQEAVVPLETRNASSYLLAFDNTNSVLLGVAIENLSVQAVNVPVVLRDDTGTQIGTASIPLNGNGHTSFVLSTQFPVTANIRGTVEFDTPGVGSPTPGQISVLGIRYTPPGTLTTTPALANIGTAGGSVAHIASGGGWQTTFVLVNTGTSAAQAYLNFLDDNGNPLPLPLTFPQTGGTSTGSSVTQTIAAGASLWVQSTGALTDPLLTGSLHLTTTGNISGFVILRYNPNGQEAVVPFETRNAGAYLLAFDNTNGTATGVAVNIVSAQGTSVPVILRDDTGTQIGTGSIPLAANGHSAFVLDNQFAVTANIRGTVEFDTPPGTHISVVGIRSPPALTFTTLPPLAK